VKKVVFITFFSLGVRIFAVPEICSHSEKEHAETVCHLHKTSKMTEEKKHTPCKNMPKCLLDSGDHEPMVQPSVTFLDIEAISMPIIADKTRAAEEFNPGLVFYAQLYRPPPPTLHSFTHLYLIKSTFLI